MNNQETLLDYLRQQQKAFFTAPSPSSWAKILEEWLAALEKLMTRIDGFLKAPQSNNLLRVQTYEMEVDEGKYPRYTARALRIETPSGAVVEVVPQGRWVMNATGRVDLISQYNRLPIVRFGPDEWAIMRAKPDGDGWDRTPLDADSFSAALLQVLL